MAATETGRRSPIKHLTAIFPEGHEGTQRDVRRLVSERTGVPQSRIDVLRVPEHEVQQEITVLNLTPWTEDYRDLTGWTPYVHVTGAALYEGRLDR